MKTKPAEEADQACPVQSKKPSQADELSQLERAAYVRGLTVRHLDDPGQPYLVCTLDEVRPGKEMMGGSANEVMDFLRRRPCVKPDPHELAELRARLHARVLTNLQLGREADERFEKASDKVYGAMLDQQREHIKALQRRLGDLEALATALMVIIDPIRILNPDDKRLARYNSDDCGGCCTQEQLQLTDLGNVPRGGDISAHDFLVAVVHQPYYCLLNGHKGVPPGTPPEGKLPVYQNER